MMIKRILLTSALLLIAVLSFSSCGKSGDETGTDSRPSGSSSVVSANDVSGSEQKDEKTGTSAEFSGTAAAVTESRTNTNTATDSKKVFEPSGYTAEEKEKSKTAISSKLKLLSLGNSDSVMCAEIENVSESDIEYCRLKASAGEKEAVFVVSVLPKGESAIVFEESKRAYSSDFLGAVWKTEDEILFEKPLETMSDELEINLGETSLTVKNKTGADIDKTIYICYKTVISGNLSGSVSYRMKLDGIKKGETRELFSNNINKNSRVVYVRYGN